ncbi:ATP-binding cassette domain-containing protein [Desulfovibrio intestinalis]|uniref:Molybdate transport system ATP-binding protein n=1 Tax=Desulfovibrio intestinalis TaxID=58621 RepID=A0A7W8C569_9BACT|nr:ATP-binding cassette domain-containing protein [Desulfovibrio intestinalis]MBB5144539.1 molybdate transport system ATP-binding protein [Desulfovibrio intestinalis]
MFEPLVTIENLSLFLPGDASQRTVLHHIDWRIERGRHCALLGANGSGKSTLLRLLRGELWPASGHIWWHTAEGPEQSPLAGRAMTTLVSPAQQENYQRQAWDLTGLDLLLTGFEDTPLIYSDGGNQAFARREAAVRMASRLEAEGLLDRDTPTLSQGQLRLLLLGRALLRAPALLLLDECTDGLDARYREIFFDVLEEYAPRCTIVMTAHRPGQIPEWCVERRYVSEGRLYTIPPEQADGGGQFMPDLQKTANDICETESLPPLLDLENVTVFIDRQKVLRDITWSVHQGEHWRISGANGSGKSTLLRLLAGDEFTAAGGTLERWLPHQGGAVDTLAEVRKGVRLVSDLSQALYGYSLTAHEMVCTGFDNSIGVYRKFSPAEKAEALRRMQEMFPEESAEDVEALGRQSIRHLSTGQLRRLFLARALVGEPDILLLDEPCSGLDAPSRAHYLNLLDQLAIKGLHIVFVSHHGEDAPLCINREAQMEDGRLRVMV